ncbi:MAG: hypothetical protein J7K54_04800 [Candidatus Aenigmarchaeota archaeon]|nr:hypothetical protein [Candidatus Aenigmarchaeota archaeon]
MSIAEYRRIRCDSCGKEETVRNGYDLPYGWFTITAAESLGPVEVTRFEKDACSEKCVLEIMHGLKKLPPRKQFRR